MLFVFNGFHKPLEMNIAFPFHDLFCSISIFFFGVDFRLVLFCFSILFCLCLNAMPLFQEELKELPCLSNAFCVCFKFVLSLFTMGLSHFNDLVIYSKQCLKLDLSNKHLATDIKKLYFRSFSNHDIQIPVQRDSSSGRTSRWRYFHKSK